MIKDGLYHMQENQSERGFKGKFEVKNTKKGFTITMLEEPYFMLGASESAFKNHKNNTVSFINNKVIKYIITTINIGHITIKNMPINIIAIIIKIVIIAAFI